MKYSRRGRLVGESTRGVVRLLGLSALGTVLARADVPPLAEESGLQPKTPTLYLNPPGSGETPLNNGRVQGIGIGIGNNGNVMVGWEDDGADLTDYRGVWMLFDPNGSLLTPEAAIPSLVTPSVNIFSRYRAFFRQNESPTPANTAYGPIIKANLFGDGLGFGATAFSLGLEIAELAQVNFQTSLGGAAGEFTAVQLVNNEGQPSAETLSGFSEPDADRPGDVRFGDWDFLSNGNLVIVSESRQAQDLVELFGGDIPANHAAFRILKPDGTVVKPLTLVGENPVKAELWQGVGVTKDGFAVRFAKGATGRATVRLFKNDGTPVTGDIDLGTLAGSEIYATGGRGDSVGFHGNGNDAYVVVARTRDPDPEINVNTPYVMVINADGTLRYARKVADDFPKANTARVDAAMTPDGRVVVAFDGSQFSTTRLVQARLFNADGSPMSPTFLVSEKETPATATSDSRHPRIAWRGNQIAIAWESTSFPKVSSRVVALRIFELAENRTTLDFRVVGEDMTLTWEGGGALQNSTDPGGPWQDVPGASSPFAIRMNSDHNYFRVR